MQAKAGRCFSSLIALQIDELSNYASTIILISSFLSCKLTVITPLKLMTVSYPNTLKLLGHNTEKNRRVLFFLFAVCSKK